MKRPNSAIAGFLRPFSKGFRNRIILRKAAWLFLPPRRWPGEADYRKARFADGRIRPTELAAKQRHQASMMLGEMVPQSAQTDGVVVDPSDGDLDLVIGFF